MDFSTNNRAFEAENADEWQGIEAAPAQSKRRNRKPEAKRLPYAVLDDRRLRLADLFFLIWRAWHAAKWTSRPEQLKQEHGFGPDLLYPAMNNVKVLGYLKREQPRNRVNGYWEYAAEVLNLKAPPSGGRAGFLMLEAALEAELAGMPWRQYTSLVYLRSHASGFLASADFLGARFGLSEKQIRRIVSEPGSCPVAWCN